MCKHSPEWLVINPSGLSPIIANKSSCMYILHYHDKSRYKTTSIKHDD